MNTTSPNRAHGILLFALVAAALATYTPLFITGGAGAFDFWWWMTANIVGLTGVAAIFDRSFRTTLRDDLRSGRLRKVLLGLWSAALLYIVFAAGNILSRRLLNFAGSDISAVYDFKTGASGVRIALLMVLVIGPGEELFWRVFLQRALADRHGALRGWILTTLLYTLIHAGSGNVMLMLAALVCGAVWGGLYYRFKSPLLNVVSHTAWDVAVFLLFPFT